MAWRCFANISALYRPKSFEVNAICRCRLLISMVSASIIVILPTPARASSSALVQPIPPAPMISTLASFSFLVLQYPNHLIKSDDYRDAFPHY